MKGIEAIISAILLLMISVALVATSYAWFSGLFGTVTGGGSNVTEKGVSGIQTTFDIETATANALRTSVNVSIRNTGTVAIDTSKTPLSAYIADVSATGNITAQPASLAAGAVGTVSITIGPAACDKTLELSLGVGTPQTEKILCP